MPSRDAVAGFEVQLGWCAVQVRGGDVCSCKMM
jgi:hypothetical protein